MHNKGGEQVTYFGAIIIGLIVINVLIAWSGGTGTKLPSTDFNTVQKTMETENSFLSNSRDSLFKVSSYSYASSEAREELMQSFEIDRREEQ